MLLFTVYTVFCLLFQSPKKSSFDVEPVSRSMTSYETMKQETKKSAAVYTLVSLLCIILFSTFLNPLPDDKSLDWSKLKQTADDISKCF